MSHLFIRTFIVYQFIQNPARIEIRKLVRFKQLEKSFRLIIQTPEGSQYWMRKRPRRVCHLGDLYGL